MRTIEATMAPEAGELASDREGLDVAAVPSRSRSRGRRTLRRSGRATWIVVAILSTAACFEAVSDNPVHAGFLYAVAFALVADAVAGGSRPRDHRVNPTRAPLTRRAEQVLVLALLLYAFLAGFLARFTWPMSVAVLVPGAAAVAVGWHRAERETAEPPITRRGALQWSSVFVAIALWELTNLLLQPSLRSDSHAHPTMSVLMDPVLATHAGRSVTLAAWLVVGWFLLER